MTADSTFCAASERLFNTPHLRQIAEHQKRISAAERLTQCRRQPMRINRIFGCFETELHGADAPSVFKSSAGERPAAAINGPRVMKHAATVMHRIPANLRRSRQKMEVGPSASADDRDGERRRAGQKLNSRAMLSVKKMPNWAAAPNKTPSGLRAEGSKSIIAPMPMKRSSGKAHLQCRCQIKRPVRPLLRPCVTAPESGRLTRIVN